MQLLMGVRNFGKITFAEVNINSFSVFVGNNNSGKTYMMQLIYGVRKNLLKYTHDFQSKYLDEIKEAEKTGKIILDAESGKAVEVYLNDILKENKEKIVSDTFHENIGIGELYLKICFKDEERIEFLLWDSEKDRISIDNIKQKLFGIKDNETELLQNILLNAKRDSIRTVIIIANQFIGNEKNTISIEINTYLKNKEKLHVGVNAILNSVIEERKEMLFLPASRTGLLLLYKEFFAHKADEAFNILEANDNKKSNEAAKIGLTQPVYEFIRFVQTFFPESPINDKYKELIDFIQSHLIDGELILDKGNQAFYLEHNVDKTIPLYLSSSMINELAPILYALQSVTHPTYLIWDEIETSLHPQKQIELVRLLSRMNNLGFSLIVSTHSDTMATKINNLCILSYSEALKEKKNEILKQARLEEEDLLKNKIHVYQFINSEDGTSYVMELEYNEYSGYEFTQFNDSVEKLFLETKLIME